MTRGVALVGAVACACALSLLGNATAVAFESYYNCVNKPSNLWCDGRANGSFDGLSSWDYNEAWNPGTGSLPVCERVWKPSSGGVLGTPGCGYNWIAHYYGNVQCSCYEANVEHLASGNRNINGYANSDF